MKRLMRPLSVLTLAASLFAAGQTIAASNTAVIVVQVKNSKPLIINSDSKIPFDTIKDNENCYSGKKGQVIAILQNAIDLQNANGGGQYGSKYSIESVSKAFQSGIYENVFEITLSGNRANYGSDKFVAYIPECTRINSGF